MRHTILIAIAAAFMATPALADGTVTAADLHARCTADMSACATPVHWVQQNAATCTPPSVTEDEISKRVLHWLDKHKDKTGQSDNDLVGLAIGDIWPCR